MDANFVVKGALDLSQCLDWFFTFVQLFKSDSVVSASFLVSAWLDQDALWVLLARIHGLSIVGAGLCSLALLVTNQAHIVVALGKLTAVELRIWTRAVELGDTLFESAESLVQLFVELKVKRANVEVCLDVFAVDSQCLCVQTQQGVEQITG